MDKNDKRFKLLDATMRRHGYRANALIESLHTAQQAYGYLDPEVLQTVAKALKLPPSKVYGVATFYNAFALKPQGAHTCVVCMGTACYVKGAARILDDLAQALHLHPGETAPDQQASLLQARCFGSCSMAPVVTFDGEIVGDATSDEVTRRIQAWLTTTKVDVTS
jgi:bidirectional [NiFe] hydrogenase diaphorase subunit